MDYIKIIDIWPEEGMLANIDSIEKILAWQCIMCLSILAKWRQIFFFM